MLATGTRARATLLALLLSTRAAADWVQISQQHYRKPVRIESTTRGGPHENIQKPTRNTYLDQHDALETPKRDTYLDQNIQNPTKTGIRKDVLLKNPTKSAHHYHDVSVVDPIRDDLFTIGAHRDVPDQDVKPERFNQFLQENGSQPNQKKITHIYQDASKIPTKGIYNNDEDVQTPIRDDFLNHDLPLHNPMRETYLNHSIAEHNWIQNGHTHNIVRGDRVTIKEDWNKNTYRKNYERDDNTNEKRQYEPKGSLIKDETVSGKIERVTNIGSVKRVQLANTPVKSPFAKVNNISENYNRKKYFGSHTYENFSDELNIETDIFKDSNEAKVSLIPSNNLKHEFNSTKEVTQEKTRITDVGQRKISKVPNEKVKSSTSNIYRHYFTPKPEFDADITELKGNLRYNQNNVSNVTENLVKKTEMNSNTAPNNKPAKPLDESSINEDFPDFFDEEFINTKKKVNEAKNNADRGSVNSEKTHKDENKSSSEQNEKANTSGEMKVNTIENILKFVKIVADTISKNTRSGSNGKITYLNELKNTLLDNIKDRIDVAWPDDTSEGTRRRSRAASPRGHVEFPSSESSLMTISFLTFAVFLIKLVLQVIQTYKHKTMMMAPLMVSTAGRTISKNLRVN